MSRKAMADKVIVLGVDGFEPSLAKKFMDQGKMPNLQKFVDSGSARKDLVLLGGVPTVTPPMWTTLATGAYPATHGITAFFNQYPGKLDTAIYALDATMCRAEQVWNVTAEAGLGTLVWHWPGSSWPPSSSSANLAVVDGTQPGAVNMGVAIIDWEKIGMASEEMTEVRFAAHDAPSDGVNGCVITGLEDTIAKEDGATSGADSMKAVLGAAGREFTGLVMDESENEIATLGNVNLDVINSPIKPAEGWAAAPAEAKEFVIITSAGFVRRPCLILKNDQGIYDRIAVYKSKKDEKPIYQLHKNEFGFGNYVDEINDRGSIKQANRSMVILELAEDGSQIRYWMSVAYDIHNDSVWHPKSLHQEIVENVSYIPPVCMVSGKNPEHASEILVKVWDHYCQWQADCLNYLMETERYQVIFSHLHNVDLVGHQFWHYAKHFEDWGNDAAFYQGLIEYTYKQTDDYLGRFLDKMAAGWTVIITSDHGLICEENHVPVLSEGMVNVPVMQELGYTILKKDNNGKDLREIDWQKTRAVAIRGCYIYINLKGRNETGIVAPEEQYDLEAQIISDLYSYRDPRTGKRVVALALRNKDAIALGLGGPECGDIVFFMEEGFNIIHMDSLATQKGYFDTSVSPIFVAAGKGIKAGYTTERVIRQVDVAPTISALLGVRMTHENEGSVVHKILTETF